MVSSMSKVLALPLALTLLAPSLPRAQEPAAASPAAPAPPAADAGPAAAAPRRGPQFYFASYPGSIVQFDPATDEVVRRIPFANGMPWDVSLAFDRRRFFVVTDQQKKVEIVDLDQGAVTAVHEFVEEGYIVRVRSVQEIPGGKEWYVRSDRIKKHVDRYAFEPTRTVRYDVESRKVVETMRRLPEALARGARISPDGRYWHSFSREGDLVVIDPKTLKEVAKVDLSTPLFSGMGRLQIGRTDLFDGKNPKMYRMLCTFHDRVQQGRSVWGYVDIDLEQNRIADTVEWGLGPSGFGTYVAHDGKRAAAQGGGSDRRSRISVHSLEDGKKVGETWLEMRPRQHLAGISPDGQKLYVGGAGSDFEVYDAATFAKIRTIAFDGEIYGQVYVLDG